jgi:hypothetical protein
MRAMKTPACKVAMISTSLSSGLDSVSPGEQHLRAGHASVSGRRGHSRRPPPPPPHLSRIFSAIDFSAGSNSLSSASTERCTSPARPLRRLT